MPWHTSKSSECPTSKPWAVIKDSDGSVAGCHVSKSAARAQMAALYASESGKALDRSVMDDTRPHITLKAVTIAADEGIFEAVISTITIDRDRDIVMPAGVVAAMKKWADLGKMMPLAYHHSEEVVGHIDPATARVEND